jgi:hypothetical protein
VKVAQIGAVDVVVAVVVDRAADVDLGWARAGGSQMRPVVAVVDLEVERSLAQRSVG